MRSEPFRGVLAKPEPRARVKARADRAFAKKRKACRLVVLERAGWRCQRCRMPISDDLPEWHTQRAHVNEMALRSGGADPTNPDHCEAICQGCHYPNGQHAPTAERQAAILSHRRAEHGL